MQIPDVHICVENVELTCKLPFMSRSVVNAAAPAEAG